jgi:hypothetical protein
MSVGGYSSNAGRPVSGTSAAGTNTSDQKAADQDLSNMELLNQTHDPIRVVAAAAPESAKDDFVSRHSTHVAKTLVTCENCGTNCENGFTVCIKLVFLLVYIVMAIKLRAFPAASSTHFVARKKLLSKS